MSHCRGRCGQRLVRRPRGQGAQHLGVRERVRRPLRGAHRGGRLRGGARRLLRRRWASRRVPSPHPLGCKKLAIHLTTR